MAILVLLLLLLAAVLSGLRGLGIIGPGRELGWMAFCAFVVAVLLERAAAGL